nr:hypothetical protein [Candidatus Sigynarchaeota archaeon]
MTPDKNGNDIPHKEGMKQVTFWISKFDLARWDKFIKDKGKNRSKLIIQAVDMHIAQSGGVPSDDASEKAQVNAALDQRLKDLAIQLADFKAQWAANAKIEKRKPDTDLASKVFPIVKMASRPDAEGRSGIRVEDLAGLLESEESTILDILTLSSDYRMDGTGFWTVKEQAKAKANGI